MSGLDTMTNNVETRVVEHIDVKKAIATAREAFIADRTQAEYRFNEWYTGLLGCSKEDVLDKLPYNYDNMSFKTECPAFYEDIPNEMDCVEQLLALNEKMNIANNIVNELNKDNLIKLEQYRKEKGITV